jgi:hypothetical protein
MEKWLSGARGVVVLLAMWVVGWGLGFGGLIEAFIDPDGEIMDVWPTAMAAPGLVGGIAFAALLLVFERGKRLDQVPIEHHTAWGVLVGLGLGAFAVFSGAAENTENLNLNAVEAFAWLTGLGAVAGFGSGVFFWLLTHWPRRRVADRAG